MPKIKQTPGSALRAMFKKHHMNCNRLAKAIGMSNAIVRLMTLDESPISVSAAFRLAKFFKTKPEFWLSMQLEYSLAAAAKDKKLAKELKDIPDVDHFVFKRKPRKAKSGRPSGKTRTTKGTRGRGRPLKSVKRGRKPKAATRRTHG